MINGGAGGDGSVTAINVQTELNYTEKEIVLIKGQTHKIDNSKIGLVNQNITQSGISIGSISYEIQNLEIATIDSTGTITAIEKGHTKLKIKDDTNEIETYVYIKVIDKTTPMLSTGNNFTIALKENGTVWSFGKNDVGQLGSGDNTNSNKPVSVKYANSTDLLQNITQISSGYNHSVALSKEGKVYTWGANANRTAR